jgi:hypothetical protein
VKRLDADPLAGLVLLANIGRARAIIANKNGAQPRRYIMRNECLDPLRDIG